MYGIYVGSGVAEIRQEKKEKEERCESSWGGRRTVRMNENDFGTVGPSAGGTKTDSDVRHSCAV